MSIKISEIRLLNIEVKKDGNKIYRGKTEDAPEEIKQMQYKEIRFDGVDVIIEI